MDRLSIVRILNSMGLTYSGCFKKSDVNKNQLVKDNSIPGAGFYFYFNHIPKDNFAHDKDIYVAFVEGSDSSVLKDKPFISRPSGKTVLRLPKAHEYLFLLGVQRASMNSKVGVITCWQENKDSKPIFFVTGYLGITQEKPTKLDEAMSLEDPKKSQTY